MKPTLAAAFRREMDASRVAWAAGDDDAAFGSLERAHILGQRHLVPHIITHLWMLRIGWKRRDRREIIGQLLRLMATLPGALIGWVPAGNTGGADVSALRPMPLPPEFEVHFAGTSMARTVITRLALLALIALLALAAVVGVMEWRRAALAQAFEAQPPDSAGARRNHLGSTRRLEVIPLVNWHAGAPGLATEAGVAYLVRTDHATLLFDLG